MKKTSLVFITLIVIYFSCIAMIKDSQSLRKDKHNKSLMKWVDQKKKNIVLPGNETESHPKMGSRRLFDRSPRDVERSFQ